MKQTNVSITDASARPAHHEQQTSTNPAKTEIAKHAQPSAPQTEAATISVPRTKPSTDVQSDPSPTLSSLLASDGSTVDAASLVAAHSGLDPKRVFALLDLDDE